MSTPLDVNPRSGGDPAKPSSPSNRATDTIVDVEGATSMLEETRIDNEDPALQNCERQNGKKKIVNENDNGDDELNEDDDLEVLEGNDIDIMEMLPAQVKCRVDKLKKLNRARESIMVKYLAERAALENKYSALCKPLYVQRLDIIQGFRDDIIAKERGPVAEDDDEDDEDSDIVGVPQFWVCAMGHMENVAELVTKKDVDCLLSLKDVTCEDFPDGKGFTLLFHFEENEYFSTRVLTKTYEIPNLLLDDEPILKNVKGCTIEWKAPAKALTYNLVTKKQRAKKGKHVGQIRTVTRRERCDSFFHFFNPPKMPAMEDLDEEEADAIEEAFDHDYDVAQAFRKHLIPKGVLWYTGEALDEDLEIISDEIPQTIYSKFA